MSKKSLNFQEYNGMFQVFFALNVKIKNVTLQDMHLLLREMGQEVRRASQYVHAYYSWFPKCFSYDWEGNRALKFDYHTSRYQIK